MSRHEDIREPIEYVVDQYFKKMRTMDTNLNKKLTEDDLVDPVYATSPDLELPQHPVTLIRGDDGKLIKAIYGDVDLLDSDEEGSPIVWQEELVRGADGKLEKVITTYPDGEEVENILHRTADGKLERYE